MRLDVDAALFYMGAQAGAPTSLRGEAASIAQEMEESLSPRYVYRVFSLQWQQGGAYLPEAGLILPGSLARTMLGECSKAALLACTLGAEFDRRLLSLSARDMARAVIWDACGSAYVETGCDAAQEELASHFPGQYLTDRFSPGYGDLPLSIQPQLCAALDAQRRIGLHVLGSLLLNPTKSVTAIIGIAGRPQMGRIRGCAHCAFKETCALRKEGKTCAP